MKIRRHVLGAAFFLGLVAPAHPTATAQQGLPPTWVRIRVVERGHSTLKKVCAYDSSRGQDAAPSQCWTIQTSEPVVWNRGHDSSSFNIRVFRPDVATPLCQRNKIGNVYQVGVFAWVDAKLNASCNITTWDPPRLPYRIRVCNENVNETVNFALAYSVDDLSETVVVAEGWWKLKYGECERFIDLAGRMKKWRNPARHVYYEVKPRFFIYAETKGVLGGAIKQVMEADEDDGDAVSVCIRKDMNFEYRHGLTTPRQCLGSKHERVRMHPIRPLHSFAPQDYYWTF